MHVPILKAPLTMVRHLSRLSPVLALLALVTTLSAAENLSAADKAAWWAFQPLRSVQPPPVRDASWVRNPIDRFILAPLEAANLSPAPQANRGTLIRRANFDLLGLPPTASAWTAFEQDPAPTPEAWRRLISQLLQSPHYGERWARHWLDVARFAESSGFEHDYDRPSAYHFRDFVIRALNDDMPYTQFVRWQLAGDEFAPDDPLALMATGFLGAGVFPTQITANEVERTRYDAMDDMLATTGTAMLGLTIGCARCHDHKFDPISTQEYYRLLATFTTTTRSELELDLDPAAFRREKAAFDAMHAPLEEALRNYERQSLPAQFDAWLAAGARLPAQPIWRTLEPSGLRSDAGATFHQLDDGSHRVEGKNGDSDRYTLVAPLPDSGSIAALRLEALADPSLVKGGPGRADNGNIGLSRIRIFTSSAAGSSNELGIASAHATFEQNTNTLAIRAALDDNPRTGWAIDPRFGTNHAAVFVLSQPLPATRGQTLGVILEFQLNTRHNLGRFRLSVSSSPDAPLDGSGVPAPIALLLARLHGSAETSTPLSPSDRATLRDWWKSSDPGWKSRADAVATHLRSAPKPKLTKVLTCTEGNTPVRMHTQGADFFPETHFLNRGSTDQKRGVASQGFLQVLARTQDPQRHWTWTPPAGAKFSGRRRSLANWMTDTESGAGHLLARVIVNRLWQHHFGRGIVETPNDFGIQGARPTHPELLDWLAQELIRNDWKLKPIHQLILESAAYQVVADRTPSSGSSQPSGPLSYPHFQPRRLTAESIRDAMLFVTGVLDPKMYGPGTLDPASTRRSIYFTVKRSQLIPDMQVFDAPEPLVSQATRPATTVAPQALLLMNSPNVRKWAEALARHLAATHPNAPLEQTTRSLYAETLTRSPSANELTAAVAFLKRQSEVYQTAQDASVAGNLAAAHTRALTDLAQTILSLNEFVYVE